MIERPTIQPIREAAVERPRIAPIGKPVPGPTTDDAAPSPGAAEPECLDCTVASVEAVEATARKREKRDR